MKKLVRKERSIEDRIHAVGDIERCLAMLVYGAQKTGKTVFACTFPKPLLLIDIKEKGEDSVTDVEGVDVIHAETRQDLEDLYWYLEPGNTKYKSVVLDQLTGLQKLSIAEIKGKKGQKPDDVFSTRSYGQLSGWMNTWLLNYRDLITRGLHVCFLAHEKRIEPQEEDDDRMTPEVTAELTASIVSFANGAVSVIGNQFIREEYDKKTKESTKEFCMRVGPHAFYRAGMRRPVSAGPIPDYIVNPSFDKIMKLSKGESIARKVKRK